MSLLFFFGGAAVAPNTVTLAAVANDAATAWSVTNTPPPNAGVLGLLPSAPVIGLTAVNNPPASTLSLGLAAQTSLMAFHGEAVMIAGSFAFASRDVATAFGVAVTATNPYDLVSSAYVTSALAAGNLTLSPAQTAILPTLITACSREIIRFLGRNPNLVTYDEIVTPEGARQDRGEPASARLSSFPVQSVLRCSTGRSTALLIQNNDPTTNQFANVVFNVTGDVEYLDLVYTGLTLTRVASGVPTENVINWPTSPPYMTVAALAAAINGLGGGWSASVTSPTLGLWPTAELVGVREPKNAFSPGAGLDVFATPASSYDIDRASGTLNLYGLGGSGTWASAPGGPTGFSWDGLGDRGTGALGWSQFRVTYTAGWATVPESLQQVCTELVRLTYARLKRDPTIQSETQVDASWTAREEIEGLPDWAIQILTFYKDWRV